MYSVGFMVLGGAGFGAYQMHPDFNGRTIDVQLNPFINLDAALEINALPATRVGLTAAPIATPRMRQQEYRPL